MDLHVYLHLAKKWWWLILVGTIISGSASFLVSRSQTPVYQASSLLLLGIGSSNPNNSFIVTSQNRHLTETYQNLLTTEDIIEEVRRRIGVERIGKVRAEVVTEGGLIRLTVNNPDPALAQHIANEMPLVFSEIDKARQQDRFESSRTSLEAEISEVRAELLASETQLEEATTDNDADISNSDVIRLRETLSRLVQSYENVRLAEATNAISVTIVEQAQLPKAPISPRVGLNTLLAMIVGAMLTVGIIFLIDYLDNSIKEPEQIFSLTGLTTLGGILRLPPALQNDTLVVRSNPRSPIAEGYRQIRTNLQYSGLSHQINSIQVTSATPSEGKTTTISNLALALGQANHKVLLVDADLRRPRLHKLFQTRLQPGLTELMLNENSLNYAHNVAPNVQLLTAGKIPPNPAELLHSPRMKELIAWLTTQVDYVLFDTPPVLAVADASILSSSMNSVVIVIRAGSTKEHDLLATVEQLGKMGADIAGIILNDITEASGSYYHQYHHYYEEDESITDGSESGNNDKDFLGRQHPAWLLRLRRAFSIKRQTNI